MCLFVFWGSGFFLNCVSGLHYTFRIFRSHLCRVSDSTYLQHLFIVLITFPRSSNSSRHGTVTIPHRVLPPSPLGRLQSHTWLSVLPCILSSLNFSPSNADRIIHITLKTSLGAVVQGHWHTSTPGTHLVHPASHLRPGRHAAGSQPSSAWAEGPDLHRARASSAYALIYACHLLLNARLGFIQQHFVPVLLLHFSRTFYFSCIKKPSASAWIDPPISYHLQIESNVIN